MAIPINVARTAGATADSRCRTAGIGTILVPPRSDPTTIRDFTAITSSRTRRVVLSMTTESESTGSGDQSLARAGNPADHDVIGPAGDRVRGEHHPAAHYSFLEIFLLHFLCNTLNSGEMCINSFCNYLTFISNFSLNCVDINIFFNKIQP